MAGGFGSGTSLSRAPTEIAPVVPYRGGRTHLPAGEGEEQMKARDVESIESAEEEAPIVSEDTPFFHFDLASAVRAAESGLARRNSGSNAGGSEVSSLRSKQPQVSEVPNKSDI